MPLTLVLTRNALSLFTRPTRFHTASAKSRLWRDPALREAYSLNRKGRLRGPWSGFSWSGLFLHPVHHFKLRLIGARLRIESPGRPDGAAYPDEFPRSARDRSTRHVGCAFLGAVGAGRVLR